jgi:hypothetical protein
MENKVLIAGIDTIEIGYCIVGYKEELINFEDLKKAKEFAQSTQYDNEFSTVEINGVLFMVQRAGSRNYEYVLINSDVTIKISDKAKSGLYYPEVMVCYRSEFLWRVGWQIAVNSVGAWLDTWAVACQNKISRLDCCCDISMPLPVLDNDLKQISTRARAKDIKIENMQFSKKMHGKRITGYVAGGNQLMCRIYNKSYEINKHGKQWFNDLWLANGLTEGQDVTRIEFQCRREFLKEMHIDNTNDLQYLLGALWDYLTNKWLRIVDTVSDSNKKRLNNIVFWDLAVKAVDKFGMLIKGMNRYKIIEPKEVMLFKQARGCMITIGAMGCQVLDKNGVEYGINEIKAMTRELLKDPYLYKDVEKRMYKMNGFPPTLLTGGVINTKMI